MSELELCGIRTRVPRMMLVLEAIRLYSALDAPVLIQGETGTGKELVAHALHTLSHRAAGPLITADCGALSETLAESELFGHERGAFTGADRRYGGRIEAAAGGTIFLDEVNSISLAIQAKLLRFLETLEVTRVGQQRPIPVDVRVVGATNVRLEDLVASGLMRPDFFYRVNVMRIDIPPLRERLDDLPLLVAQFFAEDPLARKLGVKSAVQKVVSQLRGFAWPGNVRELFNTLRRSIVLGADSDVLRRLSDDHGAIEQPAAAAGPSQGPHILGFRNWIQDRERRYLTDLIEHYQSIAEQVEVSGLPQRTLYRKLRALGLRGR